MKDIQAEKIEAVKKFLTEENIATPEEVEKDLILSDDLDKFEIFSNEYLVLTEAEADGFAEDEIMNSLWAFKPEFILDHTDFVNDITQREAEIWIEAMREMQSKLCESANTIVKSFINNYKDEFIADAIESDGRGHFISFYDGEEHEVNGYYIYRIS